MTIVEINHLQVTFAEKTAVSAASFSVNAGETFSLIGESGCGKSTILRVIAGLQRDWRGRYRCLGAPSNQACVFRAISAAMCKWCFRIPMPHCIPIIRCGERWLNRSKSVVNVK